MNLDKLTVNVRPLSGFQAMDLGMVMARQWFRPLWGLWWRRMLPVMMLLSVVCVAKIGWSLEFSWGWLFLLLWWLKPFAEVPLVIFLSQKLFDADMTAAQAWQHCLNVPKSDNQSLLIRQRLGFRRQLLMPIVLLEREPNQRRQRLQLLSQGQSNALIWQTLAFLHIESLLYVGVMVFAIELLPQTVLEDLPMRAWVQSLPTWLEIVLLFVYLLVMSVIAVFYMASGFAAYICKRSVLEGWDIELKFRNMVNRHQAMQSSNTPIDSFANTPTRQ